MALDSDTYGTVARVERLVGDLVQGRSFSLNSIPTLAQVEGFLDDTASELNSALTFAEYTVPVVVGTDTAAFNYLAHGNSCGAAFLVLDALPAEAYTEPGEESPSQGRKQSYERIFWNLIKVIKAEQIPAEKTSGGTILAPFKVGSAMDANGNTTKPIFTRSLTDNPSSRSLTS